MKPDLFGGFELNHHWHGIDILVVFECFLLLTAICLLMAILTDRKWLKRTAIIAGALCATAAWAANTTLGNLSSGSAISATDLFYDVQSVGTGGVKVTGTQLDTFINSKFSGDCTVASGGAVTCLKTNGTSFTGAATATYGTGSWTPVDASSASLTFTGVSGAYTQIGNMVFAYGELTYPVTANGSNAIIGGLPINIPNQAYAQGGCIVGYRNPAVLDGIYTIQNSATFAFVTSTSAIATNAYMSASTVTFNCIYPAA